MPCPRLAHAAHASEFYRSSRGSLISRFYPATRTGRGHLVVYRYAPLRGWLAISACACFIYHDATTPPVVPASFEPLLLCCVSGCSVRTLKHVVNPCHPFCARFCMPLYETPLSMHHSSSFRGGAPLFLCASHARSRSFHTASSSHCRFLLRGSI